MSLFHSDHSYDRQQRRQFLKKSFAFLGAWTSAPGTARPAPPKGAQAGKVETGPLPSSAPGDAAHAAGRAGRPEPYRVFDAHLHCPSEDGNVWQWYPVTRSFEEFVGYLDRTNVSRGVINSVRCQLAKSPAEFIAGNREVARYVERYRGRFLGACVVNPLFIDEALREIEDCRKQLGFVWVGELCNYTVPYPYTIKEFTMLVEQVVKQNMVLDVHTELEEMEYIIQKFPQATIVFPHFGPSPQHIFKRIDLVARNSNCYIDTSGSGQERMGILEYSIKTIGSHRVLFGSDFSINDPGTVLARIENSYLTDQQKRQVLSENLERLLKKVEAKQ
jgi:uncharacterized protein